MFAITGFVSLAFWNGQRLKLDILLLNLFRFAIQTISICLILDSWINVNQLFTLSLTRSVFSFTEYKYLPHLQGSISLHNEGTQILQLKS